MVHFLIDNTLGAWWVNRNPGVTPPVKFEYLRTLEDGAPAAGNFEGWPDKTALVTSLDPCMGSGHFVASLFPVFAALRMHEEGLTKEEATDKVITENLHGLELDARCTQIAAFNLALTSWKFCGHYKELPEMNLACSGIAPKGKKEDWIKLVANEKNPETKQKLENGMSMLYDHFQLAPELGSLLDPTTIKADAFTASFEELQPVLVNALKGESNSEQIERGVIASGITKGGKILSNKFDLIITNVPFLGRRKQSDFLVSFADKNFIRGKSDLATIFIDRILKLLKNNGTVTCVSPYNWVFQSTYSKFREHNLKKYSWNYIIKLGEGAFVSTQAAGAFAGLFSLTNSNNKNDKIIFIDLDIYNNLTDKIKGLSSGELEFINQNKQIENPNFIITSSKADYSANNLLKAYADCYQGISPSDRGRLVRYFWENHKILVDWEYLQGSFDINGLCLGYSQTIAFDYFKKNLKQLGGALRGTKAWNLDGVSISKMRVLKVCLYSKKPYDGNAHALIPKKIENLTAIWSFCNDDSFNASVRKIDGKLDVTNSSIEKIPFDLEHWKKVADEKYPNGLPKPYSDDPTQWLFHGHPLKTENPLQVATARLLGYRWPAESDEDMELAEEAKKLIEEVKSFNSFTDDDGIFCIPSVNAEQAGADRLRTFLQAVFGAQYNNKTINELLEKEGAKAPNLEDWFRNEFFIQHCKVFGNRPFIWHIWDGRKDGFSALVNYHKLDKENLSKLIYTYLGDWIRMCEAKRKAGDSGADGLWDGANKLQEKLILILNGEAPYDIFVRWKPLSEQPIGWEPDLNDGMRLNIRPFVEAGVLRSKFNVKWGVDRGKNPPNSHWGEIRDNDRHLSLEEKRVSKESNK
jgi:hypothetical protein